MIARMTKIGKNIHENNLARSYDSVSRLRTPMKDSLRTLCLSDMFVSVRK